jgi:hypothetical protein
MVAPCGDRLIKMKSHHRMMESPGQPRGVMHESHDEFVAMQYIILRRNKINAIRALRRREARQQGERSLCVAPQLPE